MSKRYEKNKLKNPDNDPKVEQINQLWNLLGTADDEREKLLKLCFRLCESIYQVVTEGEDPKSLLEIVDNSVVDSDFKDYLNHKYILKDMYDNIEEIDDSFIDDVEDLKIIQKE